MLAPCVCAGRNSRPASIRVIRPMRMGRQYQLASLVSAWGSEHGQPSELSNNLDSCRSGRSSVSGLLATAVSRNSVIEQFRPSGCLKRKAVIHSHCSDLPDRRPNPSSLRRHLCDSFDHCPNTAIGHHPARQALKGCFQTRSSAPGRACPPICRFGPT